MLLRESPMMIKIRCRALVGRRKWREKKVGRGPRPKVIMAGLEWPSGEEARKNVQIQFCPAEFPVTAVVLVRGG